MYLDSLILLLLFFFLISGEEEAFVFQLANKLPPVTRGGTGRHLRGAWCLWARGNSLWPLWQEDLDLGKLPLQGVDNLRVFSRVYLLSRYV